MDVGLLSICGASNVIAQLMAPAESGSTSTTYAATSDLACPGRKSNTSLENQTRGHQQATSIRLGGNIEVEIHDDVATAFRVGDLNQQGEEMIWEPWQRGEAAINCYLDEQMGLRQDQP